MKNYTILAAVGLIAFISSSDNAQALTLTAGAETTSVYSLDKLTVEDFGTDREKLRRKIATLEIELADQNQIINDENASKGAKERAAKKKAKLEAEIKKLREELERTPN